MRALLIVMILGAVAPAAWAQAPAERVVRWRALAADRSATVRAYPSEDERRPTTIVVDDAATNGAPVTDDAQFVADLVAREVGVDPTAATFVFRFTPQSFSEAAPGRGKTLLLGATFRRTASGGLGAPAWRVLSSDALAALTDRAAR